MFGFSPQQLGKPLLFRPEGPQAAALHSGGASGGSSGGAGSAFDPSFAFQQVSQKQLTPQVDHFEQRARDVADVEKHILDLGTIFGKLQHMIHEQGDMLARCVV